MKKFILGTKQHMVQVWNEEGECSSATVLSAGPAVVTQVKSADKDGYTSVQIGFGEKSERNTNKAAKGHFKDMGNFRYVREFRVDEKEVGVFKIGDTMDISSFAVGDTVEASGVSKGKGFQGVVKRHGFKGGPRSHGQKHSEREAGAIGGSGGRAGGRVAKDIRMAGRMGGDRITVKNLEVLGVDAKSNQMLVSGAIPGRRGTLIEIRG